MTAGPKQATVRKIVTYLALRLTAAAIGVACYFGLARIVVIQQQDQVAPMFFAIATVMGVVGGFLGAAVFFVAGASGPSIDRIRAEHGKSLNATLLGAMAVLMLSAFGATVCGLFSNGFGAKAAMAGILALVACEVVVLGLALAVALKSGSEPPRPAREMYVPGS
ncbi:hypothetical protein [Rhodococcus sp. Chr-9]|uniref:hypothetical protein n=1 Tax=Rhodococcus sp. Chr-9 TaxID=713612 RepID=UPI0005742553|nr:hypothetical protein [Rhodococcus sp. Chr-9]KHJ74172.1 hypothetical protein QR64_03040 [Rhodococcus sp. Chr-9]